MGFLSAILSQWAGMSNGEQLLCLTAVVSPLLYLSWRLWRFTIVPALRSDEPPPLPYWIPVVGHVFSLFKGQEALMEYGRTYFKSRPFALTAVGQTLYIQTDLADINATYRAPADAISFDAGVKEFYTTWGASADGSDKMWRLGFRGAGYPNPHGKSLGQLSHDIQRATLEAAAGLAGLAASFQASMEPLLAPSGIPDGCRVSSSSSSPSPFPTGGKDELHVDLMRLCWQVLIPAGTETFFGRALRAQRADLDAQFVDFDADSWRLIMQLPPSMAKRCYEARAVCIEAMCAYVELPAEQKADACGMVGTLQAEMAALGMATRDAALSLFLLYWLINVNSFKQSFWMLAHVLFDADLRTALMDELASTVPGPEAAVDVQRLLDAGASPVLNALFDETQRVYVSAASTRSVLADTTLNGRRYRAGAKILVPYRQLHFDEAVFGARVAAFDHTRFLHIKGLARNARFKPFGGGSTLCTGRFIARREVLMFVATVLSRWDIGLVGGQTFPVVEMSKPGLGVMEPKEGQTIVVRMTPKVK